MLPTPMYYDDYGGLWGSNLSALECTYVRNGLKRVCIDFLGPAKIPLLEQFCTRHQLKYELSDYKILGHREKAKRGFSNACSRVPRDSEQGQFAVFLSRDRLDAQLCKNFYAVGEHVKVAPLLGYPACCAEFFQQHLGRAARKNMDFILYALRDVRQHDFYTNRALRCFDMALISHFPCSLDCAASQSIGRERLAFLQREHPAVAARLAEHLKSLVLYTEDQGIFFSKDYRLEDNRVRFQNLHGTVENGLFQRLCAVGELVVKAHDELLIGPDRLTGDVGILLFR